MLIITVTHKSKTYTERIPDSQTRRHMDPKFYRDAAFVLEDRSSLEPYRDHFISGYLESLWQEGELPQSFLRAEKLEVSVRWEEE